MNSSFWIALVGIVGTLVGVWLGNFLQNRNLKRQQDWLLHDQKSEWLRKQKKDDFNRILAYIETTLNLLTTIGNTLKSVSKEKQDELILDFKKQVASVIPTIEAIKINDKEFTDLFDKFIYEKDEIFNIIFSTKDASKGNATNIIKVAGQIKKRINDSLAETFD